MDAGARSRYPGAQPFADDNLSRKLFRGRERETTSLTNQICANRLVVLYARSGVGKTSLLNAGVAENLRAEGLLPLTVRVNDTVTGPLESVYRGVAAACARQEVEYGSGDKRTLWHFFQTAEFWTKDARLTPVLILDQFEELFTLQTEKQRGAFIDQLSYLIRGVRPPSPTSEATDKDASRVPITPSPPEIRVVISLREDFLPDLEELADRIPEILHQRFRLQPLARDAASRALEEPAGIEDPNLATRPFEIESQGKDAILNFLAWKAPSTVRKSSADIEPFQLQLLCQHFERIVETKQHQNPQNDVKITVGEIGGWSNLTSILEEFYVKQLGAIPSFWERRAVRRLCREFLISPQGRRLRMEESEIERHSSVKPARLRSLVDNRLLRAEQSREGTYYELGHDSLINAVLDSDRWSLFFGAGWHFVVGLLFVIFGGFSLFSAAVSGIIMPIGFFFGSEVKDEDQWILIIMLVSVPFYGVMGWAFWRLGRRRIRKSKEMRGRSRVSRAG